jgi:hypothetical protein
MRLLQLVRSCFDSNAPLGRRYVSAWLYGVVVLTGSHLLKGGSLSLEESAWLAFAAAVIVYVALGVDTVYKLARYRQEDAVHQWQLRPLTRVLIVVAWVFLILFIAGVTNAPGLALLLVVPLLPVMLGINRYVRRNRNGLPPVDGLGISQRWSNVR